MRVSLLLALVLSVSTAVADNGAARVWGELKAKREALSAFHQEFEETETFSIAQNTRSFRRQTIIDASKRKWRQRSVSGSGDRIRIFDGNDVFVMDAGGDEYMRTKRKANDPDPEPVPYRSDFDLNKAKVIGRFPCAFSNDNRTCVVIEAPVKPWVRTANAGQINRMLSGISRQAFDVETGLLVRSDTQEIIENGRSSSRSHVTFVLKKISYGTAIDESFFKLQESGLREVKEFTHWNAGRITKELVGKPAPELELNDIKGNQVSLSALKGKIVLLDFWTTWCPPCLADAPVLDRLYSKYARKNLMIVGISVDEDRETLEKFLEKHPHDFPVVLTTENEMPHLYQIGSFPTYIVIAPDGTVSSAFDGDKGFGELRKHLAKAGMEAD